MNTVGLSEQELVNDVLAVATLATVELSHSAYLSLKCIPCVPDPILVLVHIVNFYLEKGNEAHLPRLKEIARSNSPSAIEHLALYAREALRLDPITVGVTREAGSSMVVPGVTKHVSLRPGDLVFLSLKKANREEVCTHFEIVWSLDLKKRFIQPESHAARNHPSIEDSRKYEVFMGDGVARLLSEDFVLTVGVLIRH